MCANYLPSPRDHIARDFGLDPRDYVFKAEAYPGSMAPVVRLARNRDGGSGEPEVVSAMFGMVPHWAETKLARQTYNSRSETTAQKPAFRHAWKNRQFCVIPARTIFEPCYETGEPVRWAIGPREGDTLGIAGIWEMKAGVDGGAPLLSFSMLTINADDSPLMRRFHKPDDEKRSVVILRPDQYDAWLRAELTEAPELLTLYPSENLQAAPAPRPAAAKKPAAPKAKATGKGADRDGDAPQAEETGRTGDLFS
jgi:putative SOS response-associated peptidase YedK